MQPKEPHLVLRLGVQRFAVRHRAQDGERPAHLSVRGLEGEAQLRSGRRQDRRAGVGRRATIESGSSFRWRRTPPPRTSAARSPPSAAAVAVWPPSP